MKKKLSTIAIVLCFFQNVYSQATSLTVDCQNPGWLSSMIIFDDQKTLKHLTVTGYLNSSDLQFIADLNKNRSLKVVDLENASFVGETDDIYSRYYLRGGYFQKIVLPKTVKSIASYYSSDSMNGDSLIWTSPNIKEIDVESDLGKFLYTYIPEGVEKIGGMNNRPQNSRITFPNSIKSVEGSSSTKDLIVYSFIKNPESVSAFFETYYNTLSGEHRGYWSAINNSLFYIPKGTKEKYLNSDFATKQKCVNGVNGYYGENNGNTFIEYYDIDSVIVKSPIHMYIGDMQPLEVSIYPNDNLVSRVDYCSTNSEIASVQSDGTIVARGYGQAEVSATPYVFIEGLETKTGSCLVNVIAHVEDVYMQESMSLHIGEELVLNAKTLPLEITDNKICFESNNLSIAIVNEKGVVTGLQKGTCTITATSIDGGYTATCEVTVTQAVESLAIEKHSITMKVGESDRLFAQISPATADDKTISWHSSNEQIASVDANGNVIAQKAGEVWIKAISNDNAEVKDSCKVIVSQPVTGIQLDNESYQLTGIGKSFEMKATVTPDDASNKNIKWRSADEAVCVVSHGQANASENPNCTITSTGKGTCTIIASTVEGGYTTICVVTVKMPKYKLIYKVDGEVYKTYEFEQGSMITPEPAPTKKGYTFSGWTEIPETMPAYDVTVLGNTYIPGDANGDGQVTVTDIGVIVDIILGKTTAGSRKMQQEAEPQ